MKFYEPKGKLPPTCIYRVHPTRLNALETPAPSIFREEVTVYVIANKTFSRN
jgi:hypothetical protein